MDLNTLYGQRDALSRYPEKQFVALRAPVNAHQPVLFLNDALAVRKADYFNMNVMEDSGYTIHIVTHENVVLFYVIDVKTPLFKLVKNCLVVRTRKRWNELTDSKGTQVRYQLNDFVVLSNANQTAAVFARNITTDPKT